MFNPQANVDLWNETEVFCTFLANFMFFLEFQKLLTLRNRKKEEINPIRCPRAAVIIISSLYTIFTHCLLSCA